MKNLIKIINSEKSLEEKLNYLISNCKIETSYMSNMKYAIEQSKFDYHYSIHNNVVIKKLECTTPSGISNTIVWNLEHCVGEFVIQLEEEINNQSNHIDYLENELFKCGEIIQKNIKTKAYSEEEMKMNLIYCVSE